MHPGMTRTQFKKPVGAHQMERHTKSIEIGSTDADSLEDGHLLSL